jgi:hypothetical protein
LYHLTYQATISLTDACMQQHIVEGFQGQLEAIEGVHSQEMLEYRSALLDATVSKRGCSQLGEAMARILKVQLKNIIRALEKRAKMVESGESKSFLQVRKKRIDVLDSGIVAMVELWWYRETRFFPNWKDTVKKFKYQKDSLLHALHLLLESHVCTIPMSGLVFLWQTLSKPDMHA